MLNILYRSVNIGHRIHWISYRKCAYDIVYDIVCLHYDIVCQPTISYVDIRYRRVQRIQMDAIGIIRVNNQIFGSLNLATFKFLDHSSTPQ